MQPTYEQTLEMARALPPSELRKLGRWIQSQQDQTGYSESKRAQVEEEVRKFKLAMKWIDEHRQEFLGQWVCLEGDELIGHGLDAVQLHQDARAKGITAPFIVCVAEEPEYYGGGIEMCR